MKTRVNVDNRARIRKGLEPIQPSEVTIEFSVEELSEAEREWVAKHYASDGDYIGTGTGGRYYPLTVEDGSKEALLSAIRAEVNRLESSRVYRAKRKRKEEEDYVA